MSQLALSDSFEYICYGSTAIINIFTVRGSATESDVCRRQVLTYKEVPALKGLNSEVTTCASWRLYMIDRF